MPTQRVNASDEAFTRRPLRDTGMPVLAQRCATAMGCPRNRAISAQPRRESLLRFALPWRVGGLRRWLGMLAFDAAKHARVDCILFIWLRPAEMTK